MKSSILRKLLLLLSVLYTGIVSLGQIPTKPVNLQSPNAAAFSIFGEIPVSLYTGTPEISVPLYTVQEGGISVPISISYHASGFRPDQHPGWVGMGWSLNAGGTITRIVRDLRDEDNLMFNNSPMGFLYIGATLNHYQESDASSLNYFTQANVATFDTEPDEFSFSFSGYSGKFYRTPTGQWKVKSDRPLKVELIGTKYNDLPKIWPYDDDAATISGFVITTDDGTKYTFGNSSTSIEYSVNFFHYNDEDVWTASSWHLTKIQAVNGDEVNFNYTRGDYINQMYTTVSNQGWEVYIPNVAYCEGENLINSFDRFTSYGGMLISPVYLDEVVTSNAKVKLTSTPSTELRFNEDRTVQGNGVYEGQVMSLMTNPGLMQRLWGNGKNSYPSCLQNLIWRKLDKIEVSQRNGATLLPVRSFEFTYSSSNTQRLTLMSLAEVGADGSRNPPYKFRYDESKPLPGYLESKTDHWGFYNNRYAGNINVNTYYSYREPDPEFARAGTLVGIVYPTGGATSFEYEPHTYSKVLSENRAAGLDPSFSTERYAGGLRIKRITSHDPLSPSPKVVKEYSYSGGILGGRSKYFFTDYRLNSRYTQGAVLTLNIFSTQSVLPGSINAAGSHVGYSTVTEKSSDGGHTVFEFSNFGNYGGHSLDEAGVSLQPDLTAYEPVSSLEAQRGRLLSETMYTGQKVIVQRKTYTYLALNKANEFVKAVKSRYIGVDCPGADKYGEATGYRNYTFSYLPATETTVTYPSGPTVTKTFTYDSNRRLLSSVTSTDSRGQALSTVYRRPYDLVSTPVYATMSNAANHILSPVVEEINSVAGNQVSKVTSSYIQEGTKFLPTLSQSQAGSTDPVVTRQVLGFDGKMNVIFSSVNPSSPVTCYVWGYSHQYPIAKVENAPYSAVVAALGGQAAVDAFRDQPNPSYADVTAFLAPLRTDVALQGASVTSYTYKPLVGMTTMRDPNGIVSFFEYDSFQRLVNVRDSNGDIVKNYTYNVRPPVFYNDELSGLYAKSNCVASLEGGDVTYTVPALSYVSWDSQQDANNQALADIEENGQDYADNQQACIIYARYEAVNPGYDSYSDPNGGYYSEETADVYVRFYADMACTVPVALPFDVTFNTRESYSSNSSYGYASQAYELELQALQGETEVYMGNYATSSFYSTSNYWETTSWQMDVTVLEVRKDYIYPYLRPEETYYEY